MVHFLYSKLFHFWGQNKYYVICHLYRSGQECVYNIVWWPVGSLAVTNLMQHDSGHLRGRNRCLYLAIEAFPSWHFLILRLDTFFQAGIQSY